MKNGLIITLSIGLLVSAGLYFKELNNSPSFVKIEDSNIFDDKKDKRASTQISPFTAEYLNVSVNNNTIDTDMATTAHHEELSKPSQIPTDIKAKLCLSDSAKDRCEINFAIDFIKEIFDADSGHLKSDEIAAIITSANYNEVLEELSLSQKSDDVYLRQSDYNIELSNIVSEINDLTSSGVFCNEQVCGASIQYQDSESVDTFKKRFFQGKKGKGNIFITEVPKTDDQYAEMRLFFLPGITAPITTRIK
ncbi:MAG: hypothetical protein MJK12_02190 [Colwellia sp.]|nr:hypothetical protein [Colwellia sp.]